MSGWLQLYAYVANSAPVILLCGIIAGVWRWKKGGATRKWLWAYLCAGFLLDMLSRYLGYIAAAKNNLIMLPVGGMIDVIFVSGLYGFFVRLMFHRLLLILSGTAIVYVGISIYIKLTQPAGMGGFELYEKVLCDGVIILYALVSMLDMLKGTKRIEPVLIRINTILLLCFSMDMLTALLSNFLVNAGLNYVLYFWALRMVLMLTLYMTLTLAVWQTGKNPKLLQFG